MLRMCCSRRQVSSKRANCVVPRILSGSALLMSCCFAARCRAVMGGRLMWPHQTSGPAHTALAASARC